MSRTVDRVESNDKLPKRVDIVVIGAGIVGSTAAYFLAKQGLSVAIVEKGFVAAEQSSRNWGWCRELGRSLDEAPLATLSLDLWAKLSAEIQEDVGFRQNGTLSVTEDAAEAGEWDEWLVKAREHGVRGELLTGARLRQMSPDTTKQFAGGLYSPTEGFADPGKAAPAIARAAQRLGVSIHQTCAARGLELSAGKVSAVVTELGTIGCDRVLCAGGAWTSMFCRSLGVRLPQAGVFATAFRTQVAPQVYSGAFGTDGVTFRPRADGGYTVGMRGKGHVELSFHHLLYGMQFFPLYMRRRKNVRLTLGSTAFKGPEAIRHWTLDEVSPFEKWRILDTKPDMNLVNTGLAQLRALIPALKEVEIAEAWGGFIESSPDTTPIISPVEKIPGFFVATGFSGRGFGLGPGAGFLAADMVAEANPPVNAAPFRLSRFDNGAKVRLPYIP